MLSVLGTLAETIIRGMTVVAGYVTNSSTFPQPLSEEEEAKYLARLQTGDEQARSVLIERNLRLVAHIVNTTWAELQGCLSYGGGPTRQISRGSFFPSGALERLHFNIGFMVEGIVVYISK